MLFKLIILIFIIICSFRDEVQKELEEDKKDYERIVGRRYE